MQQWNDFINKGVPKNVLDHLSQHVPFDMFISQDSKVEALKFILACLEDADVQFSHNETVRMEALVTFIYNNKQAGASSGGAITTAEPVIKYDPDEGLPEHNCQRREKMAHLLAQLNYKRRILVAAPPQSGKTAMAQLFVQYARMNTKMKVFAITAKDLKECSVNGLENLIKAQTNSAMSLEEFYIKIASNPDYIVVIDEAQVIYDLTEFWRSLGKAPLPKQNSFQTCGCAVLAFAAYSLPDDFTTTRHDPTLSKDTQQAPRTRSREIPAVLLKNVLSYPFVAFDETECEEVVAKFKAALSKANKADPFEADVINSIKEAVSSIHQSEETTEQIVRYHPALLYECLEKFEFMTANEIKEIVARERSHDHGEEWRLSGIQYRRVRFQNVHLFGK